ncbi:hypothetical protein GCM10027284_22650 [Cyclobacterium sediminis]
MENANRYNSNKSIVVLPFVNMSADPDNEYFSDGITEEIINALTNVRGLKVIARTSSFAFKNRNEDVRSIGKKLEVGTILEGSVRKVKKRVRITAQLINTKDGGHIWSKNFDREIDDIFALQDEISLLIADQIRENYGHFDIQNHLVEAPTQKIEAYNLYLKGRYHQLKWNIDSFNLAISYYNEATKIDPSYAIPYFGLVQCYSYLFMWQAITKIEAIKQTTIYLNKLKLTRTNLPEYHLALSNCAILLHWNLKLAHAELNKTLSINPSNIDALEALSGLYIVIGSFNEGVAIIDKALEINPLSANHSFMKGNIFFYANEYKNAIEWMDIAIQLNPNLHLAHQVKMACLLLLKKDKEFNVCFDQNKQFSFAHNFWRLKNLIQGNGEKSWQKEDYKSEFLPWELYYATQSGKLDHAFALLKTGLENQIGQYFCFRHDPFLTPLREDKRFQQIKLEHPELDIKPIKSKILRGKSLIKMETDEIKTALNALVCFMDDEEGYLNPQLSLKSLSDKINVHPNKLSWLLNEHVGKNFNEYINTFRLEAFKHKALDKTYTHLTLLGLAYECGFNSKTVFNAFFKNNTGKTPSEWVRENKK